jgi:hypothetical protein
MLLESTKLGYGAVTGNAIGGGQFSWSDQLPVLNYMDQYSKALAGPLDGDISDRDVRNVQMAAPLGTIAQSNVLFGIVQGMMDEE